MLDINAAYRRIILANHPNNTQNYTPFRKIQCDRLVHEASCMGSAIQSNPISKVSYDRQLPPVGPFSQYTSSSSGINSCHSSDEKPWKPSGGPGIHAKDSEKNVKPPAEEGTANKAEYRTMQISIVTIIDIIVSTWRLDVLISDQFRFTNAVTELSNPSTSTSSTSSTSSVSFEVVLERDKSSSGALEQTVNELTFRVHEMPNDLHVSGIQSVFRELNMRSTSLTITLTADSERKPCSARCHGNLGLIST